MMAPSQKMVLWFGIIVVPCMAAAGVLSSAATVFYCMIGLAVVVALGDAVLGMSELDGVKAEFPEVIRATSGKVFRAPLTLRDERARGLKMRCGMAFPKDISADSPYLDVSLPQGEKSVIAYWPMTAGRTGRLELPGVHLEISSILGLWKIRAKAEIHSQVRVFPNLMKEKGGLASLFLRSSLGAHVHRQIGKGRDFDQLREYIPGDPYGDIHWKATAKRGRPVTKVYQIERTQEVYVIVDASRMSARNVSRLAPSKGGVESDPADSSTTVLERFVSAALVMGLAAQRNGDMFGLLSFSDRVESFIRARSGKVQYDACRDSLYTLNPKTVSPDFSELFTFIGSNLTRRALLLFLTNLDDEVLAEDFIQNCRAAGARHLMVVNTPLVKGAGPLFSSPEVHSLDDVYKSLGGHMLWERTRQVRKRLKRRGVDHYELENEKMAAQLVSQYLRIKQRQIL